tara:strand:+ start:157 stop:441 length:285 start_codon:yes stop_codon:yes gene_type:complete
MKQLNTGKTISRIKISNMRNYKITKKSGELHNCEVTDSNGKNYQNYFDTEQQCINWVYYIWENESKVVNSDELLNNAILQCVEIDSKNNITKII